MRSMKILAVALAAAFPLAIPAQQKAEAAKVTGAVATAPGAAGAMSVVTASAIVEKVDKATRTVTLKLANGETREVVASDEVKNFDRIQKGDKLEIKYAEALTLELKKDGKAVVARQDSETIKRAAPGQMPGGVAKRETKITAEVTGIDAEKKVVFLKGPKGNVVALDIHDPEQMKLIKMGDKVEAVYTQALAVSMTPEAPAAPAAAAPKKEAAPKK
jgi:Cu/Ag efflux protein CusF